MEELEIRKQVLEAALYLQKTGLIARTWGNVSARLNDKQMVITPSGLAYENTKLEDLVIVNIDDCSYDENQRKPSSEKKVHASAYRLRKDVNFIVHTHQLYASAICAQGEDVTIEGNIFVPCAAYGLPSTDKLSNNVITTYQNNPESNMFLLEKHGVICLGKDKNDALKNAELLEKGCKALFDARVDKLYIPEKMEKYLDDYAQIVPASKNEDQQALELVKQKNAAACLYVRNGKPLSFMDAFLQHTIYRFKYSKMRNK